MVFLENLRFFELRLYSVIFGKISPSSKVGRQVSPLVGPYLVYVVSLDEAEVRPRNKGYRRITHTQKKVDLTKKSAVSLP